MQNEHLEFEARFARERGELERYELLQRARLKRVLDDVERVLYKLFIPTRLDLIKRHGT